MWAQFSASFNAPSVSSGLRHQAVISVGLELGSLVTIICLMLVNHVSNTKCRKKAQT